MHACRILFPDDGYNIDGRIGRNINPRLKRERIYWVERGCVRNSHKLICSAESEGLTNFARSETGPVHQHAVIAADNVASISLGLPPTDKIRRWGSAIGV